MKEHAEKTARQLSIIETWRNNKGCGTLIASTGFGKTYTAIMAIKKLREKYSDAHVIVVVPTINLQNQWYKELKKHKQDKETCVLVINTAYKNKYECGLLIMDEIHCYGAPEFIKVFETIKYKYILGLTATIERSDGKHEVLKKAAPIIDEVTLKECLDNDWISKYTIYNLSVNFTEDEAEDYKKRDKTFKYAAYKLGYGGRDSFTKASNILKSKTASAQDKAHAAIYYNSMRKRGEICKNAGNKIQAIVDIISLFPDRKAIVFSDSTNFADDLQEQLGDICVAFHSKMTAKQQREALKMFDDNRTKKRVISCVKALNQGLDVPDCSLGIVAAGNSKKLDNIQRTGRIFRYQPDKTAIIVNLYVPETQEVNWLRSRQESMEPMFIDDINQIV